MATIDLGKLKFSFEGDWDPSVTYETGDLVQHGSKIWYCKKSYTPNSHETFAPGDKGQGYKNYKTLWNLRKKHSEHLETDEDINAYHSFDDTSNYPYNYRPVDNHHQVVREDVGAGVMKYFFDSIRAPETLGIDENGMDVSFAEMGYYCFHQNGPDVKGYPLDFSLTADGTHGTGGVSLWTAGDDSPLKYFLNNKEVTQSHYETTLGIASTTYQDMENLNRRVELHVPVGYEKIYPFCKAYAALYDSKGIHINKGWIGHEYWDLMSMGGINYRGQYDASTQYYWGDIVSMRSYESSNTSGFYRALRDNVGAPPYVTKEMNQTRSDLMADAATTSGRSKDAMGKYSPIQSWHNSWEQISGGNSNDQAAVWASNMGRIGWKYKEPLNSCGVGIYRNRTYIDKNGCVYSLGYGSSDAAHTTRPLSYFTEIGFVFRDWNESEDKNHFGHNDPSIKGFSSNGRHTNRADKRRTPKCVQIWQGYDWKYFLFDNGEVFHKGYGGQGQAGHGQSSNTQIPQTAQNLRGVFIVKIAACGGTESNTHHCLALDDQGQVWSWGYCGNGELGRGRAEQWSAPFKIPQEYFENKRVIDIAASGHSSTSFARTQDDHLYGWGYGGSGVLGQSNTTNHYRPVKIGGGGSATNQWDPAVDGMACWQVSGYSSNTSLWVLDKNGYLWHSGYNGYGNAGGSDTTNHHDGWVKMTSAPNGDIVDIWGIHWNGYVGLFMRTKNGDTYHSGASNGYYAGLDGSTSANYPPSLVTKIKDLKEVGTSGTYSDVCHTWALNDHGEFVGQGYDSYNEGGNPIAGGNWTGEDGTYKPYHKYVPAGAKISHMIPQGCYQSTNYFGNMPWVITEDGQILLWGFSGYSSNEGNHLNGHNHWCYNSNNNGQMTNPGIGR